MKRKGITPVIAVVLLLLITVAAVGLVWGLFQQVTGDDGALNSLDARQQARSTNFDFRSVYNDTSGKGNITVNLANTGERTVNLSEEVEMFVVADGSTDGVPLGVFATQNPGWTDLPSGFSSGRFNASMDLLEPGDSMTFDTYIRFPRPTQSIGIQLRYRNVDGVMWEYTCSPQTGSTTTC